MLLRSLGIGLDLVVVHHEPARLRRHLGQRAAALAQEIEECLQACARLDGSAGNYGWILRGDESQSSTSVKLASREYEILDYRPRLTIDYSVIPEPGTALLVACGLVGLAVKRRHAA